MVADILASISEKATGKKSDLASTFRTESSEEEEAANKKREPTKPFPFNLTKPKPK